MGPTQAQLLPPTALLHPQTNFLNDLAILQETNVLIGIHGAGLMNSVRHAGGEGMLPRWQSLRSAQLAGVPARRLQLD